MGIADFDARLGQQVDEVGRDAAHDGDPFALDQVEGGGRLPLVHGDEGAAVLHGRDHRRDAAGHVIEGHVAQNLVARLHMHGAGDGLALNQHPVAVHRALGHARGAGGVDDDDRVHDVEFGGGYIQRRRIHLPRHQLRERGRARMALVHP